MITEELEQKSAAEAFMERMIGVMNGGALALMTSIGHRTGLFDTMAALPPATSEQIAEAAGLNERYVREWLGAMVTGRIIEHDAARGCYQLPPEHAASLTRAASPNNLAVPMQFLAVLGGVEDRIVECFRKGGGVPYAEYPRFHQVMAEESGQTVAAALIESILPLVPGLIEAMHRGLRVLDVGCGSGRALNLLAAAFPESDFTGYDFSEEAVGVARAEAARLKLTNVRFVVRDAATLGELEHYDLITAFDAIHDQAQPAAVLRAVAKALKPDGVFLMQDIAGSSHVHKNLEHPLAVFLYTISCMHCMTVSLALDGAGLGAMWGEEKARAMLADAGLTRVEVRQLPHDALNSYFIATKA